MSCFNRAHALLTRTLVCLRSPDRMWMVRSGYWMRHKSSCCIEFSLPGGEECFLRMYKNGTLRFLVESKSLFIQDSCLTRLGENINRVIYPWVLAANTDNRYEENHLDFHYYRMRNSPAGLSHNPHIPRAEESTYVLCYSHHAVLKEDGTCSSTRFSHPRRIQRVQSRVTFRDFSSAFSDAYVVQ